MPNNLKELRLKTKTPAKEMVAVVPVELRAAENKAAFARVRLDADLTVPRHLAQLCLRADRAVVARGSLLPRRADNVFAEDGAVLVNFDGLGFCTFAVEREKPLRICDLNTSLARHDDSLEVF